MSNKKNKDSTGQKKDILQSNQDSSSVENYKQEDKSANIDIEINELVNEIVKYLNNKNASGDANSAMNNLCNALVGMDTNNILKDESYDNILTEPNVLNRFRNAIGFNKKRIETDLEVLKKKEEEIRKEMDEVKRIRSKLRENEKENERLRKVLESKNIEDKMMTYVVSYLKDLKPQSIAANETNVNANEKEKEKVNVNGTKYKDPMCEIIWRAASDLNVIQSILDMISSIDADEVDKNGNVIVNRNDQSVKERIEKKKELKKNKIGDIENNEKNNIISKFKIWVAEIFGFDKMFNMWINLYWLFIEQSYIQRFMKCYYEIVDGKDNNNVSNVNDKDKLSDEMSDVMKGLYRSQALKKLAMMNHILKQIPKNSKDQSSEIYKRKERINNVVDGISTMIKERMIKFGPGSGGKEEKNEEKRIRIYIENEINMKITKIRKLVKRVNFNLSDDVYEKLDRLMVEMEYESGKSLEVLINDVQVENNKYRNKSTDGNKDKESLPDLKSDMKIINKVLDNMNGATSYTDEAKVLKDELEKISMILIEKRMLEDILKIVDDNHSLTRIGVEKLFDFLVSRIKEIPDSNNHELLNALKISFNKIVNNMFGYVNKQGKAEEVVKSEAEKGIIKIDTSVFVNSLKSVMNESKVNQIMKQISNEVYIYMMPCAKENKPLDFILNLIQFANNSFKSDTFYNMINTLANWIIKIKIGKINKKVSKLQQRLKEIEKELKNGKYAMEIKDTEEIDIIYEKIDGDVNKLLNKFEKKYKEYNGYISKHKEKLVYTEDLERKVKNLGFLYFVKILDHLNGEVPDLRVKRDTSTEKDGEKQNNNVQGLIQIQHGNGCKCKDCDDVDGNETIAAVVVSTVIVCMMATLLSTYISYVGEVKMSKVVMRVMYGLCMIGSVGVGVYMIYRVYFEDAEEKKKIEKIEGIVKKNAKDVKMMWSEGMTMTAMIVCTVIMIPEMMMNSIVMDEEIVNVGNVMSVAMTMAVIVAVMYVAENSVDEREERSEGYLGSGGGVRVNDVLMMAGMFVMMTMRVMESVSGYIEGWDGRVIVMIAVGTAMMMVMNVILYGMSERYRRMMGRIVVKSEEEDVLYESGLRSGIVCVMVLLGTVPSMYERVRNMMNDWPSSEVGVA